MVSLLFNVIGAPLAGKSPLELIRVYLTFPLGEKALELDRQGQSAYAVNDRRDPGLRLLPLPGDRHAAGHPGLHGPGPVRRRRRAGQAADRRRASSRW